MSFGKENIGFGMNRYYIINDDEKKEKKKEKKNKEEKKNMIIGMIIVVGFIGLFTYEFKYNNFKFTKFCIRAYFS